MTWPVGKFFCVHNLVKGYLYLLQEAPSFQRDHLVTYWTPTSTDSTWDALPRRKHWAPRWKYNPFNSHTQLYVSISEAKIKLKALMWDAEEKRKGKQPEDSFIHSMATAKGRPSWETQSIHLHNSQAMVVLCGQSGSSIAQTHIAGSSPCNMIKQDWKAENKQQK